MIGFKNFYMADETQIYDPETNEVLQTISGIIRNRRQFMSENYPEYAQCGQCGYYERKEKLITADGDSLVCPKCAEREVHVCGLCGCNTLSRIITNDTHKHVCRSCITTLPKCAICNAVYEKIENMIIMEDFNMPICHFCSPDDYDVINEYHTMKYNGDYNFHTDAPRSDKLCMGFELETTSENEDYHSRRPYARHIAKIFNDFLHFENDSSIGDGGFEMISQPASLDHLLSLEDKFKEAFKYLSENGYTSHNSRCCGLHIHVDREFFGAQEDSCIAKIIFLMMKYKDRFIHFSRRTNSQLDWCEMFDSDDSIPMLVKEGADGNRYMALNLTNNNTIEFRLWRGTLRYKTFIATLKFTNRICNLVKDTGIVELNKMSWEDILGDDEDIKAYWQSRLGR